ncbi:integumentary mucin C.1-like [Penaeus monodon]|uniref:integumentary mucin C.1-like n=1 Tax=Penaeus monodon TaxID=6687 RepID=UPI0018A7DEFE|nr:integumentary mucin C.1-like [Penaeus monodon]
MVAHIVSWVCIALSCLAFAGLAEGANLRAGSCEYNGKTYWGGQTIESLPEQCTELKCKWSADGNPTVQLMPIDGCSCTTVRALPTDHEAEDLHAQTRQTKSQCLFNGQLRWGGAVLDRIDVNCVKLVCKSVAGAQNFIETQVTSGCTCTQQTTTTTTTTTPSTTSTTTSATTSTTTPTTTTPTTTTPTTTTPTTTTPTTTTPTTTTPTTTTPTTTTPTTTTPTTTTPTTTTPTTTTPTTTTEDATVKGCKEETTTEPPTTTVSVTDTTQACAGTDTVTA